MALNPNYTFEDLDGTKCSIVEKNLTSERVEFLRKILEYNKFTVIVVPSPAAKVAAKPAVVEGEAAAEPIEATTPIETFTMGVTDLTFNPVNGVFNRTLVLPNGKFVTSAYWKEQSEVSEDTKYYWK